MCQDRPHKNVQLPKVGSQQPGSRGHGRQDLEVYKRLERNIPKVQCKPPTDYVISTYFIARPGGDMVTIEKDSEGVRESKRPQGSTSASPSTTIRSPNTQRVTQGLTGLDKDIKNEP